MTTSVEETLAQRCATQLHDAFLAYNADFGIITRRARIRFEQRDWHGTQRDAKERIELYDLHIESAAMWIKRGLRGRVKDRELWRRIKRAFTRIVDQYADAEFSKTFYSSITRRIFGTVGVEPLLEFVGEETIPLRNVGGPLIGRSYVNRDGLEQMFSEMLADCEWSVPFADPARCASFIADQVREHYRTHQKSDTVLCVDMIGSVFYRDSRAYLIGKATGWTRSAPLVIAFANKDNGIEADAVIQTERGVRVMFGFARSYFHVDLEPVGPAVVFLRKVMPRHTVHELFTMLGRAKQGKTERYRGLARHLQYSEDDFIVAPGKKGMVMAVFTLPSYDVVFKVMRDRFAPPKDISHHEVTKRYAMVVRHNKAGRLVDTQEFRMLRLQKDRIDAELLEELLSEVSERVLVDEDSIIVKHAYVERRLRPLDLYLREVEHEDAVKAVLDYGNALRELAATNVFPGDLLTKNFGVSSTGRVIFYDYDELCLLTDCNFRDIPEASTYEDEMSADPWFSVGPADVFPEEFINFLGFDTKLEQCFIEAHGDLLTAAFWRDYQERHLAGEVIEVLPYGRQGASFGHSGRP